MTENIRYGSDLVVDLLKRLGIEYVAFNPGSSFRGIHDSLVNYGSGNPQILLCQHEEISVAIAHGYAVAAGKPMVAITHDLVGLQHASMAIYNAWCDGAPVIVLGGGGPMDVSKRRPWIEWVHTALVQGNLIRDFVKWDDQPYGTTSVVESLIRSYRLATAKPRGPVYIALDSDWQESPVEKGLEIPPLRGMVQSAPISPDQAALEKVAAWLWHAEFPLIIADRHGPDPDAVGSLVELADMTGTPVIDMGRRFNFPGTSPLDLAGAEADLIPRADLVILLEAEDPFGCLHQRMGHGKDPVASLVPPGTKVVDISLRDISTRSWSNAYGRLVEVDMNVPGDSAIAVRELVSICKKLTRGREDEFRLKRKETLTRLRHRLRREWLETALSLFEARPIATEWLAHVIGEAVKGEDWVLVAGGLRGWPRRLWNWDKSYRWVGDSGGGGLGHGLGAAIGAALAHKGKNRLCIDIQPDGDLLMTPQAIWTAVKCNIPLLVVVYNNRSYFNSEDHSATVARQRGRSEVSKLIGTAIEDPPVNFAGLARDFGAYGEGPVEDPKQIRPALDRAITHIKNTGLPALVDVVCEKKERKGRK
ncbi:MAG: thiamine pyrophosphate-binding protein [Chloroflexi bacterium]|nr:thiamine pyrophosphate-binding protein [Chloroflexota bacterium]